MNFLGAPLKAMPMPLVKVMQRRQVVIPKELFEELGLMEGDYLEAELSKGKIVYTPKQIVNRDNWYWSKDGQATISASLKAAANGKLIGPFETAEEVMVELNRRKASGV